MRIGVGFLLPLAGCRLLLGFDDVTALQPEDATEPVPDAGPCQELSETCLGDTLRSCTQLGLPPVDTVCGWGCLEAPAHCALIVPTGGALTATDVTFDASLADLATTMDTSFNTTTGQIGALRPAGTGVINGIAFDIRGGAGVFRMKSLSIAGATVSGGNALVIVAFEDIEITGVLDLRGTCAVGGAPGPGGGSGGVGANGNGAGAGGRGTAVGATECGGGGGAGFGLGGSRGGAATSAIRGDAGLQFGAPEIPMLVGGSGGGGGGLPADGGSGGGGGGAVQLVSNTRVRIHIGAGINAGGCGGGRGQNSQGCGGGGGSGGAIVIEAPIVELDGGLAVNGGGGGGSQVNESTAGQNGQLSSAPATGGASSTGDGGQGGAGDQPSGEGDNAPRGGGGGGGVGRIRVNTRSGMTTVGAGFTSPSFTQANTSATQAIATVQ